MPISEKIKGLRMNKEWSQKKLAERLNVSSQAISNWERGKSYPDIANIIQLSDLFDVPLDELMKEDHDFKDALLQKKVEKKIAFFLSSFLLLIFLSIFGYFSFLAIKSHFKEINYFALAVAILGIIKFTREIKKNR